MTNPIKLGIAGLGTVGIGVVKIIQQKAETLQGRTGRKIELVAVSAKTRQKERGVNLSMYDWESDPVSLANRKDIDIFVELIGGHSGPAKDSVLAAINSGKDIVTANKALLAHHGQELAENIEKNNKSLRFEAAVAGGIPVVKALTEGLAGNSLTRVVGVMNGTCNYILTRMQSAGLSYEEVFKENYQDQIIMHMIIVENENNFLFEKKLFDKFYDKKLINYLMEADYILVSVPPKKKRDVVLSSFSKFLKKSKFKKIIYLSATSVYGNHNGKWVNESSALKGLTQFGLGRKIVEKK